MARLKVDTWRGAIRMPLPLAQWLQARADANYRSLNAELVEMVRRAKEDESTSAPMPLEPTKGSP
ncbi:hypothetical protein C7T35_01530 [Variovorax sp. WS11]|uniref:Arc family DNA-binding protein n=1 Tax=Variovorax sp. WS11 TaxID=1105204 RepID=UPI000D0DA7B7|nr:Arc family DNA-binding protein [Variovorax sp. WS11]NDZ11466.1 Arc family DNA-binding protein [Variovorax sp. WS11]PSL86674.1 hypothetical protein C7T35_01530 [Variovorax sp. WS11]